MSDELEPENLIVEEVELEDIGDDFGEESEAIEEDDE
jgi:hypothetical protein